jgi:hypothetical protein
MATFRPKLWLGLTATLAGGAAVVWTASQATAAPQAGTAFELAMAGGEGGEGGGEGGGNGAMADPLTGARADEVLEVRLILMKGHLDVGRELYLAGLTKDATPHISHPSTELYGRVEPELKAQNVPGFHDKLDALRLAFEAKATGSNFEQPYAEAIAAIDRALVAINGKSSTPPTSARLAYLVLNVAAGEYANAFDQGEDSGKITAAVEYQDALGFYHQARALVEGNAAAFKKRDANAYTQVIAHLDVLKTTWPSAAVPAQSVISASRFQTEVLTLTGLLKSFE